MKGLSKLENLITLDLSDYQIKKIRWIKILKNLKYFYLKIPKSLTCALCDIQQKLPPNIKKVEIY